MRVALLAGATDLTGSGAGGAGTGGATIAVAGGGVFGGEDSQPARKHKITAIAAHFASGWIFSGGSLKCCIPLNQYSAVMESLFWLLLEAGVALALLLLIVWWTWPRKKPRDQNKTDEAGR